MKKLKIYLWSLLGLAVSFVFSPSSVFANHRAGDYPLPGLMAMGDFNQDGKQDLAVCTEGFDVLSILLGDGQGGFIVANHIKTDTLPKGLDVGDINSDGHLDLVSIDKWGYNIRANFGDGAGVFSFAGEVNGDGEPTRVLLRDVNKDGKLDIVANAQLEGAVVIYLGDGGGGFSASPIEIELGIVDYALAGADFNKDGNLDLAVSVYDRNDPVNSSAFMVLPGDGSGNFAVGNTVSTAVQPSALETGDLNNDGNIDVVVAGAGADNDTGLFLSTYLGDGHGGFTLKQYNDLGTGSIKGEVALGDFNQDGNLDIAFPQSSKLTQRGDTSTTLLIFLGDGTGNLSAGQPVEVGREPDTAAAADLNKDGHVDLVVSNRTDGSITTLLGNGDGTFTTHATILVAIIPAP